MKENYTVCNCMKVSYGDIEDALHNLNSFSDVLEAFKGVQLATKCSTGCGGCHQKVLDIISELMMAPPVDKA
jgi:NAD(P)H-nitrite reductase large subunit